MPSEHVTHRLRGLFQRIRTDDVVDDTLLELRELGDSRLQNRTERNQRRREVAECLRDELITLLKRDPGKALSVIEALFSVEFTDWASRTLLLVRCLRHIVWCEGPTPQQRRTATSLWGELLRPETRQDVHPISVEVVVRAELECALETLSARNSPAQRILGASLLVAEIARCHPQVLTQDAQHSLVCDIWKGLNGADVDVRKASGATLNTLLELNNPTVLGQFWIDLRSTGKVSHQDSAHGTLLAVRAFLEVADHTRTIVPDWALLFDIVFSHVKPPSQSSGRHITLATYSEAVCVLPLLARHNSELFTRNIAVVEAVAAQVFRQETTEIERSAMFDAVGDLAKELPLQVPLFVAPMLHHIEHNLRCLKTSAARCLGKLAMAAKTEVRPHIVNMLDALFSVSDMFVPTQEFAQAINVICRAFPEFTSTCLERMLEILKAPLEQRGAHAEAALNSLETLGFGKLPLLPFLHRYVVCHFRSPSQRVREAAARASAKLIFSGCHEPACRQDRAGAFIHRGKDHIHLVVELQSRLLELAVGDKDSDVRVKTLRLLDARFDSTLAAQEPARQLVPVLNDKSANRQAGLLLLGRLSRRNPGCVFPMLRSVMVQCCNELQYFERPQRQGLSSVVDSLGSLVESAPELVAPYATRLLAMIVEKLKKPNVSRTLIAPLLSATARLVLHIGAEDIADVRELFPLVVGLVKECDGPQRQAAIQALSSIVRATQDVNIYTTDMTLLETLRSLLHGGFKEVWPVRHDVLALMGVIGAVNPTAINTIERNRTELAALQDAARPAPCERRERILRDTIDELVVILELPSTDDVCCAKSVDALVRIVNGVGDNREAYICHLLPTVLARMALPMPDPDSRASVMRCVTRFVSLLGANTRNYAPAIFRVVMTGLSDHNTNVVMCTVDLVTGLHCSLRHEFRPYVRDIVPILLMLEELPCIMRCLSHLVPVLEDYLHLVLPFILDVVSNTESKEDVVRLLALEVLERFIMTVPGVGDHVTRLTLTLDRLRHQLPMSHPLHGAACCVLHRLEDHHPSRLKHFNLVLPLRHECQTSFIRRLHEESSPQCLPRLVAETANTGLLRLVKRGADVNEEGGVDWLLQLCHELLRTNDLLVDCAPLAKAHPPFARAVFRLAFASKFLTSEARPELQLLCTDLRRAFQNPHLPLEVLQELLNLVEYLECTMPCHDFAEYFDDSYIDILMECSQRCNLHAKALHYAESNFTNMIAPYENAQHEGKDLRDVQLNNNSWDRLISISERIISLCNQLGLRHSAESVLQFHRKHFNTLTGRQGQFFVTDIDIYAKLQWWSESLKEHRARYSITSSVDDMVGVLRALDEQGSMIDVKREWERFRKGAGSDILKRIAPFGAHAAWLLQNWSDLSTCIEHLPANNAETKFYSAMLALRCQKKDLTKQLIRECRHSLDGAFVPLIAESYERGYRHIVSLQQLSELEEIAMMDTSTAVSKANLERLWLRRLDSMDTTPAQWHGTLANHAIVREKPFEDLHSWLRFVHICERTGNQTMARTVLEQLLHDFGTTVDTFLKDPCGGVPYSLALAVATDEHHRRRRSTDAIAVLQKFIAVCPSPATRDDSVSLAHCYRTLGEWLILQEGRDYDSAVEYLSNATALSPNDTQSWRSRARLYQDLAHRGGPRASEYARHAADGFLRCATIDQHVPDLLGLLSLWFSPHSDSVWDSVDLEVEAVLDRVPVEAWLRGIPQIVARIHSDSRGVTRAVQLLLRHILARHPQALLYPLEVNINATAQGDDVPQRREASREILRTCLSQEMVRLVHLFCRELIRCAVLRVELWHDDISNAYAAWDRSGGKEITPLVEALQALLTAEVETEPDRKCVDDFGPRLEEAIQLFQSQQEQGGEHAQDGARRLFDISASMLAQFKNLTSLEVPYVAPDLMTFERHEPTTDVPVVPGQFRSDGRFPRVAGVTHRLKVMSSAQRPRRLGVRGTDGKEYKFLLKGREDMRQDARVMQLLGVVATLLDADVAMRDALPVIYSVTPLSDNVGLAGWVGYCTTLQEVILGHRASQLRPGHQLKSIEDDRIIEEIHRESIKTLPVAQKLECFDRVLSKTSGDEMARGMWSKALRAEVWLHRRTTYVRTLATMSMVGYVLGLGDRHPNNLMLNTITGQIVHVDFGECFERTIEREYLPEKVPFRLTRMLARAMEVNTIDGNYRTTSEEVMRVLRHERENLMALLQTFVDDPLLSWRLHADEESTGQNSLHPQVEFESSIRRQSLPRGSVIRNGHPKDVAARQVKERAAQVIHRVQQKLRGTEDYAVPPRRRFAGTAPSKESDQVRTLIDQATSSEALCQHYIGWRATW